MMDAFTLPAVPQEIINLPLSQLCDHIVETHHVYIREQGPVILDLLAQIRTKDKDNHQIQEIQRAFSLLFQDLIQHLPKEEQVLFPLCKQIDSASEPMAMHCGSLKNPIGAMEYEHDRAVEILNEVRVASGNYVLSQEGDSVIESLFTRLQAFDDDLVRHMHKENNFLFPQALEQEQALG